jgi:RHS repeat-associated protein
MTNDSLHAYTYDAENRIKTLDATLATYSYSGPLRVKKVLNSQGTFTRVYIYSGSKVIAEYWDGALAREYIYLGSQLLYTVRVGETDTYHHFDHLSQRLATDSSGNVQYGGTHFPFGEGGVSDKWAFTSYERDESGLDYAMFRYYSPRIGRFMSADLPGWKRSGSTEPQPLQLRPKRPHQR